MAHIPMSKSHPVAIVRLAGAVMVHAAPPLLGNGPAPVQEFPKSRAVCRTQNTMRLEDQLRSEIACPNLSVPFAGLYQLTKD